jgi:hypothetical protein
MAIIYSDDGTPIRHSKPSSALRYAKDIAAIATPILILFVGGYLEKSRADDAAALTKTVADQQKTTGLELERIRDERERAGQRIEESRLLASLMESLLSEKTVEKQLAINIALHACGEAGREVVAVISQSNPRSQNAEYAKALLERRRSSLIEQLIAPSRGDRWNAAEELGSAWAGDPRLIPELIAFAERNAANQLAVYNVTTVLADLPPRPLVDHKIELVNFISEAEKNVPNVAKLVGIVRTKMAEPSAETKELPPG